MSSAHDTNPLCMPELTHDVREQLRAHIESVLRELDVEWRQASIDPILESEADLTERWIRTPWLVTEFDYWVAIHEAMHFRVDGPASESAADVYDHELNVWEAAIDAAIIEPSGDAAFRIRGAFGSHEDNVAPPEGLRKHLASRLPEAELPMRFK